MAVENTEQRRAACEILGWARILRDSDATVVDEHANPMIGTLLDASIGGATDTRYLRVMCGTGREFVLRVPSACKTALEAQAWGYGVDTAAIEASEGRT